MKTRGFTLVELVVVIVITGIIAASVTIFLRPAIDSYFDTRRRAELTDMADTALRRMAQDIRRAVPNSVRSSGPTCFELVPTITGGRYRMAPDTVTAGSAVLDTTTTTLSFDVLSPMATLPVAGDWVVVNNQNGNDVYAAGTNRASIAAVATPPPVATGLHRITLAAAQQFSPGYDGGRFVVVPAAEEMVTYSCVGGSLLRIVSNFNANPGASCNAAGTVVAADVANCVFVYDPGASATQQSGLVWMRLELAQPGESIILTHGAHVDNLP